MRWGVRVEVQLCVLLTTMRIMQGVTSAGAPETLLPSASSEPVQAA